MPDNLNTPDRVLDPLGGTTTGSTFNNDVVATDKAGNQLNFGAPLASQNTESVVAPDSAARATDDIVSNQRTGMEGGQHPFTDLHATALGYGRHLRGLYGDQLAPHQDALKEAEGYSQLAQHMAALKHETQNHLDTGHFAKEAAAIDRNDPDRTAKLDILQGKYPGADKSVVGLHYNEYNTANKAAATAAEKAELAKEKARSQDIEEVKIASQAITNMTNSLNKPDERREPKEYEAWNKRLAAHQKVVDDYADARAAEKAKTVAPTAPSQKSDLDVYVAAGGKASDPNAPKPNTIRGVPMATPAPAASAPTTTGAPAPNSFFPKKRP